MRLAIGILIPLLLATSARADKSILSPPISLKGKASSPASVSTPTPSTTALQSLPPSLPLIPPPPQQVCAPIDPTATGTIKGIQIALAVVVSVFAAGETAFQTWQQVK